jgi:hypothetical protein
MNYLKDAEADIKPFTAAENWEHWHCRLKSELDTIPNTSQSTLCRQKNLRDTVKRELK